MTVPPLTSQPAADHFARTLAAAKTTPPLLRSELVARERLLGRLERAAFVKLVLIEAPAGYGKTTLMLQWMQQRTAAGEGVGWLNIDQQDNDRTRLLENVQIALLANEQDKSLDILEVINRCAARHARFTLFLDEVEALQNAQSMELLELLLDYSPANLHIVIGTRTTPTLPLARLRVRDELLELDSRDLRFMQEEAAEFLSLRAHAQLSKGALDDLLAKTEGWAAALQLTALSLQRSEDRSDAVAHLSGSRTQIVEYLTADVLDHLPDRLRQFLLDTSPLRRLCAPLCDAVTQRTDSATLLTELDTANLFLEPLDSTRGWYRYHPLFAELLQGQLPAGRAGEIAAKASGWCAASGLFVEAVDYSLQARDSEAAITLMEKCIDEQLRLGQSHTVLRWLAAFSAAEIERHEHLLLSQARAAMFAAEFELAAQTIERIRRVEQSRPGQKYRDELLLLDPVLLAATGNSDLAVERAEAAWSALQNAPVENKAPIANILAYCCVGTGKYDEAQRYLREAVIGHTGPPLNVRGLVYATGVSGLAEACLGNLTGAIQRFQSIEKMVAEHGAAGFAPWEPRRLSAIASGCCAELLYETGQMDEAEELIDRYLGFFDSVLLLDSTVLTHIIKARILLLRGESMQADETLASAYRNASAKRIDRRMDAIQWERVRIALLDGDVDRARALAQVVAADRLAAEVPRFIYPDQEVNGAGIECIRLAIHTGAAEHALSWVQAHIEHARATLRRRRLLKLHILEALALRAMQRREAALDAMLAAVRLGAAMSAVRSFADEGALCAGLLHELAADQRVAKDPKLSRYVSRLSASLQTDSAEPAAQAEPEPAVGEPLSVREAQILQRLAQGYSNLAVAQQLFVSTNTIKWHLRHIYSKLGAKNRNQAVFLARQRGLMN